MGRIAGRGGLPGPAARRAADPHRPLYTTDYLGELADLRRGRLLPELAASELAVFRAVAAAPERTLVDVFESTMAGCPDAPALDDGRAAFSYRALAAEVGSLAARLRRAGIG